MGMRNYLIEGVSGTGKTRSAKNCSGVAITPLIMTPNWLIKVIRKLVKRPVSE
jgi:AAA+ superfamily predicted ATPase